MTSMGRGAILYAFIFSLANTSTNHREFRQQAFVQNIGSSHSQNCPPNVNKMVTSNLNMVKCSSLCLEGGECNAFMYKDGGDCYTGEDLHTNNDPGTLLMDGTYRLYVENCNKSNSLIGQPTSCQDIMISGVTCNGIYTIYPDNITPKTVFCDMHTLGGGWTVFQRRKDGSVNFNLNWAEYKAGFGTTDNYWIGNDMLHILTANQDTELYVIMRDWNCDVFHARYTSFWTASEADGYRLTINGYSGSAGDAMSYNNGKRFTAKDRDYDGGPGNCAVVYHDGGWWFDFCTITDLNGRYIQGMVNNDRSMHWKRIHGERYALESAAMMVRRR